jgi:CRP-like cAMP-binding protein
MDLAASVPANPHAAREGALPELERALGPSPALEVLADAARTLRVRKYHEVLHRGGPVPGLLLLHHGRLKIGFFGLDGRERAVAVAEPGHVLVDAWSPEDSPSPVSAVALESSLLWCVPTLAVHEAWRRDGELAARMFSALSYRHARLVDHLREQALLSVDQRLAGFLLARTRPAGTDRVARDLDVRTVASLLGTVREELTRAQARLQAAGAILVSRESIAIRDRALLERLADG